MHPLGNVDLQSIRNFGCSKPIASFRKMTQAAALSPHISLLALGQGPKPFLMCHGFTGPSPVGCCSVLVLLFQSVTAFGVCLETSPVFILALPFVGLDSNKGTFYECHVEVVLKTKLIRSFLVMEVLRQGNLEQGVTMSCASQIPAVAVPLPLLIRLCLPAAHGDSGISCPSYPVVSWLAGIL